MSAHLEEAIKEFQDLRDKFLSDLQALREKHKMDATIVPSWDKQKDPSEIVFEFSMPQS